VILLTIFGIGMMAFGLLMAIRPLQFSDGVLSFSNKSWYHTFEILSRLIPGIAFISAALLSDFSVLLLSVGLLFCFASVFLVWMGPSRHRKFATMLSRLGKHFRMLGYFAILFGAGIAYIGLKSAYS
jgi:uncharacterized protein YjeT (DUF2065 family)